MTPTDEELLHTYQQTGNQEALGTLYNRYMAQIYGACLSYFRDTAKAQDAVMDIYEHIVDKAKTHTIQHWQAWLYMVARNQCLQRLRKEKSAFLKESEAHRMYTESIVHPTIEGVTQEEVAALENCIGKLDHDQKTCIKAFYMDGKSYKEIAIAHSYTWKQVRSHLQNGKRNLSKCIKA